MKSPVLFAVCGAFSFLACGEDAENNLTAPTSTVGQIMGGGPSTSGTSPVGSSSAPTDGSATTGTANPPSVILPEQPMDTPDFVPDEPVMQDPSAMACQSGSTPTSLQGVVLAFAFDVSSSMGAGSTPYNTREFKWDPVVAATKSFFADPTSSGVSAMLTFFPNDMGGEGGGFGMNSAICNEDDYATPDVGLTALPSDAFAMAIDAITPPDDDSWRSGTPTMAVLRGTIQNVQALREADPANKYVIVLVTDGEPSSCSAADNDVNNVAAEAAEVAADIPTYVVGVANPVTEEEPNPPDSVANLDVIAEQGGTGTAFIINTDNPAQTASDFRAVIESIRMNSFSCALPIPAPPPGKTFNSEKVNVTYRNNIGETPFVYDPTCTERFAWHYDDEANPTVIEMCDQVCMDIRGDHMNQGKLDVEFGCDTRLSTAH